MLIMPSLSSLAHGMIDGGGGGGGSRAILGEFFPQFNNVTVCFLNLDIIFQHHVHSE